MELGLNWDTRNVREASAEADFWTVQRWLHLFFGVDFGSVAQWRSYQGPSPATVASANRFSRVAEGFSTS